MERPGGHRLVFFAYYYPPLGGAGSLRALSFARHLPALGWDVTVVTPREGVYGEDPSLVGEGLDGVEVLRTGTWEPAVLLRKLRGSGSGGRGARGGAFVEEAKVGPVGAMVRRTVRRTLYFPDSARGWVRSAVAAARKAHARAPFAAALSSSPPVSAHVSARTFAEAARVPWVADWRDPWSEALEEGHPQRARARALEGELLRSAAGVVAATEGLARLLSEQRAALPAAAAVRNGYEPEDFAARPALRRSGVPEVVFTGTHYGARQDLGGFLGAVARMRARRPVRLRFLGKVDPSLPAAVERAGLAECAAFEGFATHEETVGAMEGASVLLLPVWSEDSRRGRLVCPAKTYEYLAAGAPVLALAFPDSEAAGLLTGFEGVRVHRFGDVEGIGSSLEDALEGRLRRPPGGADVSGFTRRAQAALLAGALDRAVAAQGRA